MLSPLTKHSLLGFSLLSIPASQAATLFQGGTIIAWDNSTQSLNVIRNGSILVDGHTITSIFSGPYNGTLGNVTTVDCTNDIITPGFIDTHRHSWQTAWKSIGSNTSLAEYFGRYATNAPASRIFTPEDVYIGQLLGLHEALNAGVTTVLDFAHHSWTAEHAQAGLRATVESGIRAVYAYYLQEYPRFSWNSSVELFRGLARNGTSKDGRVDIGISYDNFANGVEAQTSQVLSLAREFSIPVLTTHTVGHVYGGDNSPSVLHSLGFLNQSQTAIVFAHGSYVTASDAQLLRQTNQFISITPESEMHYGHDHPDSHLMQDQAALGVDTHFTFSTDILTQARMWLQVVRRTLYREVLERRRVPPNNPMSATQAFLLATRNGALSMHREDIGILAPGAKADLVIWNGRSPAMLGWSDPVAAVILHASVGDIKHVVVNGDFRKRDGRLVVDGYEALQERFLTSARRLQQIWRDTPLPVLEGEWNGNPVERTLEADVLRGNGTGYGQSYA